MSTEDNKASVRKAYEAVNQHHLLSCIDIFIDPKEARSLCLTVHEIKKEVL